MDNWKRTLAYILVVILIVCTVPAETVSAAYRPLVGTDGTVIPGQVNHITKFSVEGEILAPLQETDGNGTEIWVTKSIAAEPLQDGQPGEVMFRMPYGTDVTALVPIIEVSDGASISPASGQAQDFTNPVEYTVTSSPETGGVEAKWLVTCYVNNRAVSLTSDNKDLEEAFQWAVDKTNNFAVTGKWALKNKYGTSYSDANFWGQGPGKGEYQYKNQYFKSEPSFWAGYFNRTAYCPRDSAHQTVGAHLAGWHEENWNMYKTYAEWAKLGTGSRQYHTIWQVNFDGTPNYVDYTSPSSFRTEGPSNFELVEKAYNVYKWTGDERFVNDPVMWDFFTNTVVELVKQHDSQPANGVVDKQGLTTAGYNERFGSTSATETGDTLASQYKAYMAYADMLRDKGEEAEAQEWFDKAAELKDYFNQEWSVGADGPQGLYVGAVAYNTSTGELTTLDRFTREPHMFITYKAISEPGDRNNRLLQFNSDSLGRGIVDNNSNYYSPMANIEAYTYVPDGFFNYDWNETAWRWMQYIISRKDLPHEVRMQGTNGDYPEISYTYISHTVEGMMGIVPDAPNGRVATGPRLPGDTTNPQTGEAIAGVNWVQINDIPLGEHYLDVRHEGLTKSALTNHGQQEIVWEARFPGRYAYILVNGESVEAEAIEINGVPYSAVDITVEANQTVVAEASGLKPAESHKVEGRITGNMRPEGLSAQIELKQMGETILTVKADGEGYYQLSDVPQGQYTLYATVYGYKEGAMAVNISTEDLTGKDLILEREPAGMVVVLDETHLDLSVNGGPGSKQLTAFVDIYEEDDKSVLWESSDPAVVTVSGDGLVTAVGLGKAVITATSTAYPDLKAECTVTVYDFQAEAESVSLSQHAVEIALGSGMTLTATVLPEEVFDKSVTWESSDPSVAAVDQDGVVTALRLGKATITATSNNNPALSDACEVTVAEPKEPIRIPYATSIASGDATNGTMHATLKSNGTMVVSNDGGVYYVQDNSNPNPIGRWVSLDVDIPADGYYRIDFIYKSIASSSVIQSYMGYNPDGDVDVASDENKVGNPLDMRETTAIGAVNVSGELGATGTGKDALYWKKALDESYQLQKGNNTFKIVLTENPARWSLLPVALIVTPVSYITDPEPDVDKSLLEAVLEEALGLEEEAYTQESWERLEEALGVAQAVYADPDAEQGQVNEAVAALREAIDALEEEDPGEIIPVESIRITGPMEVRRKKSIQLTALLEPENATISDVTWTLLNPGLAEIDENGLLTAGSGTGFAIVQATAHNGVTTQMMIEITA